MRDCVDLLDLSTFYLLRNIKEYVEFIEDIEKAMFDDFITADILIIGCADNIEADLYLNKISNVY